MIDLLIFTTLSFSEALKDFFANQLGIHINDIVSLKDRWNPWAPLAALKPRYHQKVGTENIKNVACFCIISSIS